MQFRYHQYAIQISLICSSSPEFPMLSIIHSLSISTSRKLIKVELDYTSVKLYLIIHLCQIIHLISLVIRYTHQQQGCLLAGKGAFARKKKDLWFGLSVTLTVRYVSYWECCHGFESDDISVRVMIWFWEWWYQIESDIRLSQLGSFAEALSTELNENPRADIGFHLKLKGGPSLQALR